MKLTFLTALLIILVGLRVRERSAPVLEVTFFDVGQGDGALIRFPGGKSALIDAGGGIGDWNLGQRELLLELTRKGVLSLDLAILSHPDQDHGAGFLGILEAFPVRAFYANEAFWQGRQKPLFVGLVAEFKKRGTEQIKVGLEKTLFLGGATVRLIAVGAKSRGTNNRSLTAEISYAGCRILFTGDIEREAEAELLSHLGQVTVLKVAHHGSKTSSTPTFLARLKPRVALISSGRGNIYGHPHLSVVRRLTGQAIEVFRTDFHGFLTLRVGPEGRTTCETARGNCGSLSCQPLETPSS